MKMFPPKKPEKRCSELEKALKDIEAYTMKMLADNARLIKKATTTGGEKQ